MKKPKKTNQRERFIVKAKELGADESGKEFEWAFKKVIPSKKPKHSKTTSKP